MEDPNENNFNLDELAVYSDEDNNTYDHNTYDHTMYQDNSEEDDTLNDSNSVELETISTACPICREDYNKTNKKIYVIFPCGHSFCKKCLDKINVCAICREPIENIAINWYLQSQINEDDEEDLELIDPLYQIFIKNKDKIEELYVKYSYTSTTDRSFVPTEQRKLINKILIDLKNVKIKHDSLNRLLLPKWLKESIEEKIDKIMEYQNDIDEDLISLLPFCP